MLAASRMLRSSRVLLPIHLPSPSFSAPSWPSLSFPCKRRNKRISPIGQGRKKLAFSSDTNIMITEKRQKPSSYIQEGMGFIDHPCALAAEAARAAAKLFRTLRLIFKNKGWRLQAEMLVESVIIGCQSFTLIAVAGSLIGSILCFVEGCFFVLKSFFQYFHKSSHSGDEGGIIQSVIEAIVMFLVGSALLTFGMSLYMLFAGSNEIERSKGWPIANQRLNPKRLPASMEMQSISLAKSKIGHAIVLILQAGMLDKFKNLPLVGGLDFACFAAAVLFSSAGVFLLSRLTTQGSKITCI